MLRCLSFVMITLVAAGAQLSAADWPREVSADDLKAPVYTLSPGTDYVVAEAEHLLGSDYGTEWKESTDPRYFERNADSAGPTGGTFVVATHNRQGGDMKRVDQVAKNPAKPMAVKEAWLQLRFYVAEGQTGRYRFSWRQAHVLHDGDNDVFPAAVEKDTQFLDRGGWNARGAFNWNPGGGGQGTTMDCPRPGIYSFILISRSKGYGVDRLVAWRSGSKPTDLNIPESPLLDDDTPRASFTATPDGGESPLAVTLDASASTDDVGIVSYVWAFPDGGTASGVTVSRTFAGNGRHTIRLTVTDTDGNRASTTRDVVVSRQDPFGGSPHAIPGRIECEHFDEGGEGVAYHDSNSTNQGGQARSDEGVDLERCSDAGGGFNVGYTENGEWLEYTLNVARAGNYRVHIRSASRNSNGGAVQLSVNGTKLGNAVALPGTGAWQTWETVDAGTVRLEAGRQVLRLTVQAKGSNLNWFELVGAVSAQRRISMVNHQGVVWKLVPDSLGNDNGTRTIFEDLSSSDDHVLSAVGASNN